jgi:hypothetical protein
MSDVPIPNQPDDDEPDGQQPQPPSEPNPAS